MESSVLQVLPLEIRSKIYKEVLSSQNGIICLKRTSDDGPQYSIKVWGLGGVQELRLSFLRTCREIYEECKDKLWTWNTLNLEPLLYDGVQPFHTEVLSALPRTITANVRSVIFDFNMLIKDVVLWSMHESGLPSGFQLEATLGVLRKWTEFGKLEGITLLLKADLDDEQGLFTHDLFADLLDLRQIDMGGDPVIHSQNQISNVSRNLYRAYLDILQRAGGQDGYLQHLKRKMILRTGPYEIDKDGAICRSVPEALGDPDEMLRELNQAWGGSLEMNGISCYEDKQIVQRIFERGSGPEREGFFYYTREVTLAWAASYFS
ncbi:hypothetical protein N431DRAFT_556340 [Stipitochalara longipes BDJ]|nr:hypothetical protein N431DRAFT_556340 [Stipitochalara longipes BDJ]